MMRLITIAIACLVVGCAGCYTDRPPEHKMIEMAFFKCEKCRSIEGGIYGKGPFKSFHSEDAKTCVHNWQKVSRKEFKNLGTTWAGIDWTKEIPFWSRETTNGIPNQAPEDTARKLADPQHSP